jgi:hypothetical protein
MIFPVRRPEDHDQKNFSSRSRGIGRGRSESGKRAEILGHATVGNGARLRGLSMQELADRSGSEAVFNNTPWGRP